MKFRLRNSFSILCLSLILAACGGGKGGDEDTTGSENTAYTIFDISNPPQGKTFIVSGTIDNYDTFSGTISLEKGDRITYNNKSFFQTVVSVNLISSTNYPIVLSTTILVDPISRVPMFAFASPASEIECIAQIENALPLTAIPGAAGDLTSYSCNDNSSETGTWELIETTNGEANLALELHITDREALGNVDTDVTYVFTQDKEGNLIAFSFDLNLHGTFSISVSGS